MTTIMPTIREGLSRGLQQQAERLCAAWAALLTTRAAHNFVPRGVADVAVYRLDRRLSSCLPICGPMLGWPVFWLQTGAVARCCGKTITFRRIASTAELSSAE